MSNPACRVLVADDSAVTRRILTELLTSEPDLEVVGAASNGEEAVAFFRALKPDVALLDVEMPIMNGIEALRVIRSISRSVPVIMFSTLTVRGGEATLDALTSGATDYAAKPSGVGHVSKVLEFLRETLVPKIRLWGTRYAQAQTKPVVLTAAAPREHVDPSRPMSVPTAMSAVSLTAPGHSPTAARTLVAPAGTVRQPEPQGARRRRASVNVIAIGASTGGPNALAEVIGKLPSDLNVPIVVAQHMPPIFTQLLAERLNNNSRLQVAEGTDGAELLPGKVWVAPGDYHMRVARQGTSVVLRMSQDAPVNSCRPAVDVLFRSVADVFGASAIAVVLTGMGKDGMEGCRALRATGAGVFVQDEASSVVWGMPRAVAEAGLAEAVLPVGELASAIVSRVRAAQSFALAGAGG